VVGPKGRGRMSDTEHRDVRGEFLILDIIFIYMRRH
jgi:hypothetical protein